MTDPAQNSVPAPTPTAAPAPGQTSPLDVLDQILNDAQSKAAAQETAKEEEEKQKLQAEVERQKQEDQAKLQQQITELKTVTQSPEYQAKVDQDKQAAVQAEEHAQQMDGMEIIQLDHKKV
jgi:hypothetical protein